MTNLLIVESPAKVKKIAGFLGTGWTVEASRGHLRDLPEKELGVDIQQNFALQYQVLKARISTVNRLRKAIRAADAVYLATDPDREGEAIAWHILEVARAEAKGKRIFRVSFTAITQAAVLAAIAAPRELDQALVEAQQARRTVDRLVGYLVSPLAFKALNDRVSAGRVQSVCLRLVVEREREIDAFVPAQYWTLDARFQTREGEFEARLVSVQGQDLHLNTQDQVEKLMRGMSGAAFWIRNVKEAEKNRSPLPPFTTSTLQQAASKALSFSPEHTMAVTQALYEAGIITYMRTDSVLVAPEAQAAARQFIEQNYGVTYLPAERPVYRGKAQNAQEAHEAIRPVEVAVAPDVLKDGDGRELYRLIWQRFIASQMQPARYALKLVQIAAAPQPDAQPYPIAFLAKGRQLLFDGFLKVYEEAHEDDEESEADNVLPTLLTGQSLPFARWLPEQHTTKAPARYTEAALVNALETRGIGRPSTYASMVKTIKDKGYVRLDKKRLVPTERGTTLIDFLVERFPVIFDFTYTAHLEDELDQIASHRADRLDIVQRFWNEQFSAPLRESAVQAAQQLPRAKVLGTCPKCGGDLVERRGPHGAFAGCVNFPKCKGTAEPARFTAARKG